MANAFDDVPGEPEVAVQGDAYSGGKWESDVSQHNGFRLRGLRPLRFGSRERYAPGSPNRLEAQDSACHITHPEEKTCLSGPAIHVERNEMFQVARRVKKVTLSAAPAVTWGGALGANNVHSARSPCARRIGAKI